MAELPKSVVARLKAQAAPQEHPDADLLAAFSEQALTGRERESVLAHLATCAACREAVALAAPQPPALQPGGVFVPWYRRPQIFAWAGTLATVALVGALIVNYAQSPRFTPATSDATPPKTVRTQPAENKPAAPAEAPAADGTVAKLSRDQGTHRTNALTKPVPETTKKEKEDEERARADMDLRAAAAAPAPAQAKDQKKLEGGMLADQYSAMKQAAPALPAPSAPAAVAGAANLATDEVQRSTAVESVDVQSAAPAKSASASGSTVGGSVALYQSRAKAAPAPLVRWSISEKGKLQRSYDSGRTWQPVLANESTVFRALSVVGTQIWAGGGAATLFHSTDGGATWTKQTLPGAAADVVYLQFSDALHGSARTADGTTWSTTDGGQHWAKQ